MMPVSYTIVASPLGRLLVAATERGICRVGLALSEIELLDFLPAGARRDDDHPFLRRAAVALGGFAASPDEAMALPLDACGTEFQRRVWEALRMIPRGETRTYAAVAREMGLPPTSARAVGAACGANPVALAVPCHRAIGTDGRLHGYRWGLDLKRQLLEAEGALPKAYSLFTQES